MIPDFTLEKYPLKVNLRDGTPVCLRPIQKGDQRRLQIFLLSVPETERLFIKKPLNNGATVREWCRHPDFDHNLPLVVLRGVEIIGLATLHQRLGGWKRHIGMVTMLTHPKFRGRNLSQVLVSELIEIARHAGLRRLELELNGEREIARNALARLGFNELVRLDDYVLDMDANTHDYVLLGLDLKADEEYAGVGG